jgi:hypothetical protein
MFGGTLTLFALLLVWAYQHQKRRSLRFRVNRLMLRVSNMSYEYPFNSQDPVQARIYMMDQFNQVGSWPLKLYEEASIRHRPNQWILEVDLGNRYVYFLNLMHWHNSECGGQIQTIESRKILEAQDSALRTLRIWMPDEFGTTRADSAKHLLDALREVFRLDKYGSAYHYQYEYLRCQMRELIKDPECMTGPVPVARWALDLADQAFADDHKPDLRAVVREYLEREGIAVP